MGLSGENINVGVVGHGDLKQLVSSFKALEAELKGMNTALAASVKNYASLGAAIDKTQNRILTLQKKSRDLDKQRRQEIVTTKRLAQSETLLGAIYAKNSAIAQKKYLTSLTGLRKAMARFREETKNVMVMERGHISLLDEQANAMKRFMIQGNLTARTLDNMATKYLNLGKNMQWTGRQLMVGLTMPIAAASYTAVRSYLEWDRAIVRTSKLLDDQVDANGRVVKSSKQITEELKRSATEMSTTYGTARTNIMGDTMSIFAQIGAAEKEIKALSEMSIQFNLLGDLDDTKKAGDMVRVLFQNFRTESATAEEAIRKTGDTLKIFNAIEDETSLSMEGIAEAYPRVANTLRQFGVGAGQGIAFLSAMTQNGIDATEAANALRGALTNIPAAGAYLEDPRYMEDGKARLKILTDAIEKYNATVSVSQRLDFFNQDGTFKGADQALLQLAQGWRNMDDAQRATFARALAGKTQYERLTTLLTNVSGAMQGVQGQDYAKAIALANDLGGADARWKKQLDDIQNSDYVQWQNTLEQIRNTVQDLGKEVATSLLPVAKQFAGWLEGALQWFRELSPATRTWIMSLVGLAAVIGPITYGLGQLVILSAQLVKATFTKPLKGLFSMRESMGGTLVKTEELQKKINNLYADYLDRKIDRNALKAGIEETIAAEARLERQTRSTTAALREQGRVDASPMVGMAPRGFAPPAGMAPPSVQSNRMRDRIKRIFTSNHALSTGVLPGTSTPYPRHSEMLTLSELERAAPDIVKGVLFEEGKKQGWLSFMGGRSEKPGLKDATQAEIKRRLGVTKQYVPYAGLEAAGMGLMAAESELRSIDEQLAVMRSPEYLEGLEKTYAGLKEEGKNAADNARSLRRVRNEQAKIGDFLIRRTLLRPDQVADTDLMARLTSEMKSRLPQSYLGNPVLGERQLEKAFSQMFEELGDALPPEVGPRRSFRSRGVYQSGDASRFIKELNNRGVVSDLSIDRDEGFGRSATVGTGRSMRDLLGFDFLPESIRDVYSKTNKERIMAYMKGKAEFQFTDDEIREMIFSDEGQRRGWETREDVIDHAVQKKMSTQVREFFKRRMSAGKKAAAQMGSEWRNLGFGGEGFDFDTFLKGGILGQANVKEGDLLKLNPDMMELVVRRLSGGVPDKELFAEITEDLIKKRDEAAAAAAKMFDETVSVSSFGGDIDKHTKARNRVISEAKTPWSTAILGLGPGERGNREQIAKALDDLGDQFIAARLRDRGASPDEIQGAISEARKWRAQDQGPLIRSLKESGVGGDQMDLFGATLGDWVNQAEREAASLDEWDKVINDLDRKIEKNDKIRRSKYAKFMNVTRKSRERKIRDLEKLRDEAKIRRTQAANRLQVAQHQGRTGEFLPDGTEVTGQIFPQEADPLYDQRLEARARVVQLANDRRNRELDRLAQMGIDDRYDRDVRGRLADKYGSKRFKAAQFGKAFFSGGLLGRFNATVDPEDMRAEAMLQERNMNRGMADAKISNKEIRAQRAINAQADAQGVAPSILFPQPEETEKRTKKMSSGLKKIGGGAKEAVKSTASLAKPGNILNAATWLQPATALKKTNTSFINFAKNSKSLGRVATAGKGLFPVFDMLTMGMGSMGVQAAVSLGALGPLIPIFMGIAAVVLLVWKNWDKVSKGIGGGIKALKDGFMGIVNAVIGPFKEMFSDLNGEGENMGNMWQNIGKIINVAGHIIGAAFDVIAAAIRPIFELLAHLTRIIIKTVQLVIAIATGDWKAAWEALRDIVGTVVIAIGDIIMLVPAQLVEMLSDIISFMSDMVDKLPHSIMGMKTPVGELSDMLDGMAESVAGVGEGMRDLPDKVGGIIRGDKKKAADAADDEVEEYEEGWSQADPPPAPGPEANNNAAAEAAAEEQKTYLNSFVSSFQGKMRSIVDGWKEAALDAYDEWVEGQQAAIDNQIKSIQDLTRAEEEELQKREYLRRRADMLENMRVNKNKYTLDREKLIYEGRYDEAAQLDMQYNIDKNDANRDLQQLDEEHQRELLLKERDAQVASLEQQKEANKLKYDEQRDALQKQLDAITEYIPKNAGEAARMQQAILDTMNTYLPGYGGMATAAQEAWRASWSTAWSQTTKQVAEDSFWSGKEALKQFAKGLGIDPSVVDDAVGDFGGVSAGGGGGGHNFVDTAGYGRYGSGNNITSRSGRPYEHGSVGSSGGVTKHTGGSIGNTSMAPADVPATLQTGEYVLQRKSVAKYGRAFLDKLNEGQVFHTGGIVGGAFSKMAQGAFGAFFNNGASVGGFTWEQVKNAYMNKLGAGAGGGQWMSVGSTAGMSVAQIVDNVVKGIHPEFKRRLEMWNREMGGRFDITRGYRTMAEQAYLYDRYRRGVPGQAPAAPPGRSMHNFGLAVDLKPSRTTSAQRRAGAKYGLRWPMDYEPWHVEPIEARAWRNEILAGRVPLGGMIGTAGTLDTGKVKLLDGLFGSVGGFGFGSTDISGDAKGIVRGMMAKYGWGSDQWPALERLIHKESSWRPDAANPTSSARGLFQFLKSTWQNYITNRGGPPYWVQDVGVQAQGGLSYIRDRYGSPQAALDFHNKRNWYHTGGIVVPKFHDGNYKIQNTGLAEVAKGEKIGYDDQIGGNQIHLHFEGGFFGTDREIKKLGKEIERVMATQNRTRGSASRTFSK